MLNRVGCWQLLSSDTLVERLHFPLEATKSAEIQCSTHSSRTVVQQALARQNIRMPGPADLKRPRLVQGDGQTLHPGHGALHAVDGGLDLLHHFHPLRCVSRQLSGAEAGGVGEPLGDNSVLCNVVSECQRGLPPTVFRGGAAGGGAGGQGYLARVAESRYRDDGRYPVDDEQLLMHLEDNEFE